MNKVLQRQLTKYYHKIKKHLFGNKKEKNTFMLSLKTNIEDYINENSVTDITAIYNHFGTAENVVDSYFDEHPSINLAIYIRKQKIRKIIAVSISVILIIAVSLFVVEIYKSRGVLAEITIEYSLNHSN